MYTFNDPYSQFMNNFSGDEDMAGIMKAIGPEKAFNMHQSNAKVMRGAGIDPTSPQTMAKTSRFANERANHAYDTGRIAVAPGYFFNRQTADVERGRDYSGTERGRQSSMAQYQIEQQNKRIKQLSEQRAADRAREDYQLRQQFDHKLRQRAEDNAHLRTKDLRQFDFGLSQKGLGAAHDRAKDMKTFDFGIFEKQFNLGELGKDNQLGRNLKSSSAAHGQDMARRRLDFRNSRALAQQSHDNAMARQQNSFNNTSSLNTQGFKNSKALNTQNFNNTTALNRQNFNNTRTLNKDRYAHERNMRFG